MDATRRTLSEEYATALQAGDVCSYEEWLEDQVEATRRACRSWVELDAMRACRESYWRHRAAELAALHGSTPLSGDFMKPGPYQAMILGEPVPKGRPRVNTKTRRAYTPAPTRAYQELVAWQYVAQVKQPPIEGPVGAVLFFFHYAERRGDSDNYVKAVLDALNKLAYEDDKQVASLTAEHLTAENEAAAGVLATFFPLKGDGIDA